MALEAWPGSAVDVTVPDDIQFSRRLRRRSSIRPCLMVDALPEVEDGTSADDFVSYRPGVFVTMICPN
jgi:hypothetical protein